jgi:hypothetical protein
MFTVCHFEDLAEDQGAATSRAALPVDPGECGDCRYASVKATHRGTTYLRCTRSAWDSRLVRYPRLPVSDCVGFALTGGDLTGGDMTGGD